MSHLLVVTRDTSRYRLHGSTSTSTTPDKSDVRALKWLRPASMHFLRARAEIVWVQTTAVRTIYGAGSWLNQPINVPRASYGGDRLGQSE